MKTEQREMKYGGDDYFRVNGMIVKARDEHAALAVAKANAVKLDKNQIVIRLGRAGYARALKRAGFKMS